MSCGRRPRGTAFPAFLDSVIGTGMNPAQTRTVLGLAILVRMNSG
ncbi:hypothetical protein [Candidatus Leptofilum sp.]